MTVGIGLEIEVLVILFFLACCVNFLFLILLFPLHKVFEQLDSCMRLIIHYNRTVKSVLAEKIVPEDL